MLVYVYRAALYCEDCGASIRAELAADGKAPTDPDNELLCTPRFAGRKDGTKGYFEDMCKTALEQLNSHLAETLQSLPLETTP
jgi:hypothetical protein